jgi:hypothetical protein
MLIIVAIFKILGTASFHTLYLELPFGFQTSATILLGVYEAYL